MTLTDFLLARIADLAADVQKRGTYAVGHAERCVFEGGYEGTGDCDCGAVARVLAECEAQRRIVEDEHFDGRSGDHIEPWCSTCSDDEDLVSLPCPTLRLLALPYADHPDYREEWRT